MSYAEREVPCRDCGTMVKGRISASKPVGCIDCNVKRASNAAYQMTAKSGPAYDRWLETRGPQGRPRGT